MKKLLLILFGVSILLSGCSREIYEKSSTLDLHEYYREGFFLTPTDCVSFDYEPIGFSKAETGGREIIRIDKFTEKVKYSSLKECLALFISECKNKGADGAINLKFTESYSKSGTPCYKVTGFAIKRK